MSKKRTVFFMGVFVLMIVVIGAFLKGKKDSRLEEIFASGTIEATEVRLAFQVGGRVQRILAQEGTFVKKGDLLAQLDKRELMAMTSQARAAYHEAELRYQRMQENFRRAKNLYEAAALPKQELDEAQTNYQMAQATLKRMASALSLTELKLSYTDLRAPLKGLIMVKSAEEGEVVHPGSTILTLLDLEKVWMRAYINETDLGRVKPNQRVRVKIDSYPDKFYQGRVSFISQEAAFTPRHIQTTEIRTKLVYRIKIDLENQSLDLKPGMPAEAYIAIE